MTESTAHPQPPNVDDAVRQRIFDRTAAVNEKLLLRLTTVAVHINDGNQRDALSCLSGLERRIYAMRSLLLLLL